MSVSYLLWVLASWGLNGPDKVLDHSCAHAHILEFDANKLLCLLSHCVSIRILVMARENTML